MGHFINLYSLQAKPQTNSGWYNSRPDRFKFRNGYLRGDVVKPYLDRQVELQLHRIDTGHPTYHSRTLIEFHNDARVGHILLELLIKWLKSHRPGIYLALASDLFPFPFQ